MRIKIVLILIFCAQFVSRELKGQTINIVLPQDRDSTAHWWAISLADPFWTYLAEPASPYFFPSIRHQVNNIVIAKSQSGHITRTVVLKPNRNTLKLSEIECVKFPEKKSDMKSVFVGEVSSKLGAKDQEFVTFSFVNNFVEGSHGKKERVNDSLNLNNLPFELEMNHILYKSGFIDSTQNKFAIPYNSVYLDAKIKKLKLHYLKHYDIAKLEMEINWKFRDLTQIMH
jgi:hypothetical protein